MALQSRCTHCISGSCRSLQLCVRRSCQHSFMQTMHHHKGQMSSERPIERSAEMRGGRRGPKSLYQHWTARADDAQTQHSELARDVYTQHTFTYWGILFRSFARKDTPTIAKIWLVGRCFWISVAHYLNMKCIPTALLNVLCNVSATQGTYMGDTLVNRPSFFRARVCRKIG